MKSGASDPFADDDAESESTDESVRSDVTESGRSAESAEPASGEDNRSSSTDENAESGSSARAGSAVGSGASDPSDGSAGDTDQFDRSDLPLTLRRENVKDERENVHQLFVQNDTDRAAKDAERKLETTLGEDLYRLDAREAIYLAGMRNLDDASEILREWGYDL